MLDPVTGIICTDDNCFPPEYEKADDEYDSIDPVTKKNDITMLRGLGVLFCFLVFFMMWVFGSVSDNWSVALGILSFSALLSLSLGHAHIINKGSEPVGDSDAWDLWSVSHLIFAVGLTLAIGTGMEYGPVSSAVGSFLILFIWELVERYILAAGIGNFAKRWASESLPNGKTDLLMHLVGGIIGGLILVVL